MLPNNQRQNQNVNETLANVKPGLLFVAMILGALIAFEIFNFSTTEHALADLLGALTFIGIPWATILALAFCGIDFAGIARLFTPEQGADEPKEVWYLFGAWLLAATMNAILTWWGVSMAVASHPVESSSVIDPVTITTVVPVFVAIMVWTIRILIIGTLSLALDRLLHPGVEQRLPIQAVTNTRTTRQQVQPTRPMSIPQSLGSAVIPPRPAPSQSMHRSNAQSQAAVRQGSRFSSQVEDNESVYDPPTYGRPEPTYHSLNGSPRSNVNSTNNNNHNTGNDRFRRS